MKKENNVSIDMFQNTIFDGLEEENINDDNPFEFDNDYFEKVSINNDIQTYNFLSLNLDNISINKSVKEKTFHEEEKNISKKFVIEKKIFGPQNRKDYILKSFKVKSGRYLFNVLNKNKLRLKFYMLNSKEFTSNVNYDENKIWLKMKIQDIIQYKNEKNVNVIKRLNSLGKKNKEEFDKIKSLLNMTYKDFLVKYYFEQFDKDFNQSKNYNILKCLGFFKIMQTKGNRKKEKKIE